MDISPAELSAQCVALSEEIQERTRTVADYEIAYRLHIDPFFGNTLINAIKPSHIASWQSNLLEKLSPRRVRSIRATLNTIFEDALKDEIIDKNPIAKVKTPKLEKIESEYKRNSFQITLQKWQKRSLRLRMLDGLSRLTAALQ